MWMAASRHRFEMMRYVIMGVAGCGKTSVGIAVADRLGARYRDGDDLHPPANIEKMSAGTPLDDADRAPWLDSVGLALRDANGTILIGCSALRRMYRDKIRLAACAPVTFIHLAGSRDVIEARMAQRAGHFMPVSLLKSQFATLEPLQPDEPGFSVDISMEFDAVVDAIIKQISDANQ